LGFGADAQYSVARCETFASYWRRERPLFNGRFAGGSGICIYEKIPGPNRRSGLSGGRLEGLTDSVLKVFGV